MQTLEFLDWISIGIYFSILAGIAIWVIKSKKNNTEDYFLAGRNVGWFVVGASIFASNIGSEHVVGLAGAERVISCLCLFMKFTLGSF